MKRPKFWPWLKRPEQHDLLHAFLAHVGADVEAGERATRRAMREFLDVLAIECTREGVNDAT